MSLASPEMSYSAPVSEPLASVAVTTDAAPPAARDEVLEGFALSPDFSGTRSQNSRSAALVSHEARWESRTSDANLVDAVIDGKRKYISGEDDSLANESDADNADAVDELFADFDCELLKV